MEPDRFLPPIAPFIGPPIREIFRNLLGFLPAETETGLVAAFRRDYDAMGWRGFRVYDGVATTLEALAAQGIPAFESKAAMTQALLTEHGLDGRASCFVGDSQDDAEAAEACGMAFRAATYGFGSAPRSRIAPALSAFSDILHTFGE